MTPHQLKLDNEIRDLERAAAGHAEGVNIWAMRASLHLVPKPEEEEAERHAFERCVNEMLPLIAELRATGYDREFPYEHALNID